MNESYPVPGSETMRQPLAGQPHPHLDTRSLTTTYSNVFRASGSAEELILDFGMTAHQQTANGPEAAAMLQRLVLTWNNAKRLTLMLNELMQMHEKNHGQRQPPPTQAPA